MGVWWWHISFLNPTARLPASSGADLWAFIVNAEDLLLANTPATCGYKDKCHHCPYGTQITYLAGNFPTPWKPAAKPCVAWNEPKGPCSNSRGRLAGHLSCRQGHWKVSHAEQTDLSHGPHSQETTLSTKAPSSLNWKLDDPNSSHSSLSRPLSSLPYMSQFHQQSLVPLTALRKCVTQKSTRRK